MDKHSKRPEAETQEVGMEDQAARAVSQDVPPAAGEASAANGQQHTYGGTLGVMAEASQRTPILEDIHQQWKQAEDLDSAGLEARWEDDAVVLTGTLSSRRDKQRAENLAKRIAGDLAVRNDIVLRRPSPRSLGAFGGPWPAHAAG